MSKTLPFTGSGVAIITPFDGLKTNYDELGKLIEYHIENNTDAIIICGTTGEASTMPDEEHLAAIKYTVEKAAGRITVIAGTGQMILLTQSSFQRKLKNTVLTEFFLLLRITTRLLKRDLLLTLRLLPMQSKFLLSFTTFRQEQV